MSPVQSAPEAAAPPPGGTPPAPPGLFARYRRLSLGVRILIFMVLGVIVGLIAGERAIILQPVGDMFIRLLLLVAVPLIFFNLIAGVSSLSDAGTLGRLGGKLFIFFAFSIVSALLLGMVVTHLVQPGAGLQVSAAPQGEVAEAPGAADLLMDLIPANVFAAFAEGNVAQIVVFAILLGGATLLLPQERRERFQVASDMLAELLRKTVDLVMRLGPIGIGALAAAAVGQFGSEVFGPLSLFLGGLFLAQLTMVVLYMLMLRIFTPESPFTFLRKSAPLYATTTATCSSLASLTVSYKLAEERLRIPRSIYSFALPLGAQLNKPGTCIMLAGVLVFTAQASGTPFTMAMVAPAVLLGALMSAGSGGIPGGGLVMALIYVQAFGLPLEIAALVGGVYRLIDMGNTTLNIGGDLAIAQIVAHSEKS